MKKTKFTKLFVLILSLALLIGSAIGIAASADETDTAYAIKSMNIAHGDRTQVLIAVDAVGVDAAEIEVTYTFAGETYVASFYDYVDIYNNDTEYPVFYTKGIPAKDCGQDVLAEAHVAGTTPAAPKYKNVSVANYLFTKLYKENFISATEGEDFDKKNLYLEFIEYIASAEEVLWNMNHSADQQRVLLTDKICINAPEAYVSLVGGNFGLIANPGVATLNYTGDRANHYGWRVTTASGTDIVFSNNIYVDESAVITPYFIDSMMDFEDAEVGNGLYTEWIDQAAGKSTTTVTNIEDMGGITPNYTANEDITNGRIATGNTHVLIKEDTDGNKYLSYKTVARNNYTVTETSKGNRSNPPGFDIHFTDVDDDANVAIWSFDAIFDDSCSGPAQIMWTTKNGVNIIYPYIKGNEGKSISIQSSDGKATVANFATGKYVNIRFEYYWQEGVCQIYVDGVYQGSFTNPYSSQPHAEPGKIAYGMDGSSAQGAKFDNMFAIKVKKDYVESPISVPNYESFSGAYTTEDNSWTTEHETYQAELAAGKFTHGGASTEGYSLETVFSSTSIYFDNVSMSYGGDTKVNTDCTASVETDENGNSYAKMYNPGRISDRDRAYGMTFGTVETCASTLYYTDFDMKLVSGASYSLIVRNKHNGYSQWTIAPKNGVVNMCGVDIGAEGEWISVRLVIDVAAESPNFSVYTRNADGVYVYAGDFGAIAAGKAADVTFAGNGLKNISISATNSGESLIYLDNVASYNVAK